MHTIGVAYNGLMRLQEPMEGQERTTASRCEFRELRRSFEVRQSLGLNLACDCG